MSRYHFTTTKDSKEYDVAYGYDRPMSEYFLQVFDPELADDDTNPEGIIVDEGNRTSNKSNGAMLELYEQWNVPEHHREMLALDLPF